MKQGVGHETLSENHEGETLKLYLKGSGIAINVAADTLQMSRQNLNYHLRKEKLDEDFKRLVTDKLKIHFPLSERKDRTKAVVPIGKAVPLRLTPEEFQDAFPHWVGIPVYNQPISASFVKHYQDDNTFTPIYYLRDPRFKDCNFAAIITGDSMHSEIRHGDYVVCQEITDRSFIVFGDIYYVVAKNGLETCKYVNAMKNDDDSILLVPKNDNISPSPLKKTMIQKLYKVKGIIRGY